MNLTQPGYKENFHPHNFGPDMDSYLLPVGFLGMMDLLRSVKLNSVEEFKQGI